MSLAALIRGKATVAGKVATATPATFATDRGRTVATVAIVTVATQSKPNPHPVHLSLVPMLAEEEKAVRDWLAQINETDPATIAEVIGQCQRDADARDYFTGRAAAELPKSALFPDDRRTCDQCANLIARRCQAARRGEIVASRNYEPIRDLPRRCEGYAPGADDPDRRHGRERWPGLIQKGGE